MNKESQCKRLYDYLATHGSISVNEASTLLGIPVVMRRICDLRKRYGEGVVETKMVDGTNRFGEKCTFAKYVFKQKQTSLGV